MSTSGSWLGVWAVLTGISTIISKKSKKSDNSANNSPTSVVIIVADLMA